MLPLQALEKYFGHQSFRFGQKEIIDTILQGNNVLAVLPTGAGKSICYQIPSLVSEHFSIVISPLIALMKDQVDSLNNPSVNGEILAAFINSTMNFYETEGVLQNISYGKIKILYVAPERLENITFAERIKKLNPSYLFVDEAHCISEWGHNFRPSYRKILDFINYTGIKYISAFTATATPEVIQDIVAQLNLKSPKVFVKGFERDNLKLNLVITKKKKEKCFELITRYKTPAIIYTSSRRSAEEVSEFLTFKRISCSYYHAGLAHEERKKIQEDFLNDKIPIIAATNAFGMGIDKKDIRLIIHYNIPGTIENYYQEIGRAGRDGKESFVFLLYDDSDINIHNYFLSNSHPDKRTIHGVYNAICDYNKIAEGIQPESEIVINPEYISAYVKRNINKGLLYSTLKILQSAGYLRTISEFENKNSFRLIIDKDKLKEFVKNSSNKNLKEVILMLLRLYGSSIFSNEVQLFLSELAAKSGLQDSDIDESLILLDNLGIGKYTKPLSKNSVMLTSPRINAERLKIDYKRLNESYLNLQKKIDKMVGYVFTNECRFKYILNYFGENVENYSCNKCDNCLVEKNVSSESTEYLKELILRTFHKTGPASDSVLVSILKGSAKPDKYQKLETFGTCSNFQRNDLKTIIQIMLSGNLIKRKASNTKKFELDEEGLSYLKKINIIETSETSLEDYESDIELFNTLKEIRKHAAKKFMQTGYLICPDEVLREIVNKKPSSENEILSIKGFNQRTYNKIGKEFLEGIQKFKRKNGNETDSIQKKENKDIPQNIKETYILLKKGYQLSSIASLRNLSEAVISMQIETIIEYEPDINIKNLIGEQEINKINSEIEKGFTDLKDLKKRLPEEITYPLIRIAVAKHKFTSGSFPSRYQYMQ
ncbi:MAG: RecQ family ATP-dependent DNA helicase [Ignavibacteriaceae bacterium]